MSTAPAPLLELERIRCQYDTTPVVESLTLHLYEGDVCCLLGPSGCGKTTVLRAIAGFHPLSGGHIALRQKTISDSRRTLAPEKRHIGMVFQDYALFPHLSVRDNITYGLNRQNTAERERICEEMLTLVKLTGMAHRYPHEISGGQQQRVALARALAAGPDILLMDEPFSSLDVELRRALAIEVREILKSRNITAMLVTHDQEEAFAFADRIAVLHDGLLQQWATPFDLYHEPNSRFVANFIGQGSFLPGHVVDSTRIATELGVLRGNRCYEWPPESPVEVLLRPDDIVQDKSSGLAAEIVAKVFVGPTINYAMKLPTGSRVIAAFPSHQDFRVGDIVAIGVSADHLVAFPGATQAPLLRDKPEMKAG